MICGDRDQVGILTDIDPAIRHVPRRWRPQQRPQRSVNRLSRRLTVISRIAHGQVQEQHRARQFIDQYAGLSPDVAVALRTTARLQFAVSRWLAIDVIIIVIGPSDYLTPDRQYQGCRGLSAVERVGVASTSAANCERVMPLAGRRCNTASTRRQSWRAAGGLCRARRLRSPMPAAA